MPQLAQSRVLASGRSETRPGSLRRSPSRRLTCPEDVLALLDHPARACSLSLPIPPKRVGQLDTAALPEFWQHLTLRRAVGRARGGGLPVRLASTGFPPQKYRGAVRRAMRAGPCVLDALRVPGVV